MGVSKSLIVNFLQTGVPSHAQKRVFKHPIDPSQRYKYEKTPITSDFADFYSRHFLCLI